MGESGAIPARLILGGRPEKGVKGIARTRKRIIGPESNTRKKRIKKTALRQGPSKRKRKILQDKVPKKKKGDCLERDDRKETLNEKASEFG